MKIVNLLQGNFSKILENGKIKLQLLILKRLESIDHGKAHFFAGKKLWSRYDASVYQIPVQKT